MKENGIIHGADNGEDPEVFLRSAEEHFQACKALIDKTLTEVDSTKSIAQSLFLRQCAQIAVGNSITAKVLIAFHRQKKPSLASLKPLFDTSKGNLRYPIIKPLTKN